MADPGMRVTPVAVLVVANAVLISWAIRAHADFLPDGRMAVRVALASAFARHHAGGGAVVEPPPAVAGDALANSAGLAAVAAHLLLVGVVVVSRGSRRWLRSSLVDARRILVLVTFAGVVAVVSALVTTGTAALLGSAISSTATVSAAVEVLRYSFAIVLVSLVVLGLPYGLSGKDS
jgi:di/tricarboxylate transporter